MLARIQNDLFDLGADLCTPEDGRRAAGALRIVASPGRAARARDRRDQRRAPAALVLRAAGRHAGAAYLHLARTVARRAERLVGELAGEARINPEALKYLNRLSDHLFVLGRHVNDKGAGDVLWVPGANR